MSEKGSVRGRRSWGHGATLVVFFWAPGQSVSATLSPQATHVDHFVAWARYPIDLGHNFVLADSRCNRQKRDRLPACEHLAAWTERNARFSAQIGDAMLERGILADLTVSNHVTQWAYEQAEVAGGLTWLRADEMVPLAPEWKVLLRRVG